MEDILLGISKVLENKNMLKWFKFILKIFVHFYVI
jgi:hypothetical protein